MSPGVPFQQTELYVITEDQTKEFFTNPSQYKKVNIDNFA